jgi:hypothetical protein
MNSRRICCIEALSLHWSFGPWKKGRPWENLTWLCLLEERLWTEYEAKFVWSFLVAGFRFSMYKTYGNYLVLDYDVVFLELSRFISSSKELGVIYLLPYV